MAIAIVLIVAACTAPHGHWVSPRTVTELPHTWPQPVHDRVADRPRIESLWMNETTIRTGREWRGVIVTSTNVMSVEIRTESFTFVAQREHPGFFRFSQEVLDMVPEYRRRYTLSVIARNSSGAEDTWLVPIVIS